MSDLRIGMGPASGVPCDQCGGAIPANHRPQPVTRYDPKIGHFRPMKVCLRCLRPGDPEEKKVYSPSKLRPTPQAFRPGDLRRRGEKVNTAKLDPDKVRQIRELRNQVAIAKRFRVSQYAIWAVLTLYRWAHVA